MSTYIFVRLPDVVESHGQGEADVAEVAADLEEVGGVDAARQLLLPQPGPRHGGHQVHHEGGHHGHVVSPGQVEDARVVLLPVRDEEADVDVPEEAEHPEHGEREPVLVPPEHGVDSARDEDGGPGVQPVVEQLAQGSGGARPPDNTIQSNKTIINKV